MTRYLPALGLGGWIRRLLGVRLGRLRQYPARALMLAVPDEGPVDADDIGLPRISIVTPSLNQARFVGRTLRSVLSQDYPALDYIVQDGRSDDGSLDVIGACRDSRLRVYVEADTGQADALNRGFARSDGEVMAYLNSDDLLLPGTLRRVGRYFRDHPEVDVVYGNRLIVDENDHEIGRWILPGHDEAVLHRIDYVPQETLFWRRGIWERAGGRLDADLHFALDWDLLLRFIEAGALVHHLPELLGVFRVHGEQKTQAQLASRGRAEMARVRARHAGGRGWLRGVCRHAHFLWRHRLAEHRFTALRKAT